jgi:hypothetical protein
MSEIKPQIHADIEGGENILLLCPVFESAGTSACLDLLTPVDPAETNILCISFMRSRDGLRTKWDQHVGTAPGDAAVVDVAADTRSAEAGETASGETPADTTFAPRVEQVTTPSDLTTLGVRITDCLSDWEAQATTRRTVACFESITTLIQYADRERTFKFLHVLTDHFSSADTTAHYHLDPSVPDEEMLEMLTTLFDVVCEYDQGEWTVQSR